MKKRIAFFGNGTSPYTPAIFRGFLNKMEVCGFELVLNVDTVPQVGRRSAYLARLSRIIKRGFNPREYIEDYSGNRPFYTFAPGVPLLQVPDINDPEFLEQLSSFAPDYAILAGCPQIAKKGFLSRFRRVINMHSSLLPAYRGLDPVNWAMYNGEVRTGFTYHYVDEHIDDGDMLLQEEIPVDYRKRVSEVMREISVLAGDSAGRVLQHLKTEAGGIPQDKNSSYYGKKAKDDLLTVHDLSDYEDIRRKILFWGYVNAFYRGEWVHVTRIGRTGKILRINHLPPLLYRFLKKVKAGFFPGMLRSIITPIIIHASTINGIWDDLSGGLASSLF